MTHSKIQYVTASARFGLNLYISMWRGFKDRGSSTYDGDMSPSKLKPSWVENAFNTPNLESTL